MKHTKDHRNAAIKARAPWYKGDPTTDPRTAWLLPWLETGKWPCVHPGLAEGEDGVMVCPACGAKDPPRADVSAFAQQEQQAYDAMAEALADFHEKDPP